MNYELNTFITKEPEFVLRFFFFNNCLGSYKILVTWVTALVVMNDSGIQITSTTDGEQSALI